MPRLSIQHWKKMREMPFFRNEKRVPIFRFHHECSIPKTILNYSAHLCIKIINIFSRKSIAPCCVWISNSLALTMLMKWYRASG